MTVIDASELIKNVATRTLMAESPAGTRVVVTFTPRDPLIDGTEGKVLNRVVPLAETADRRAALRDIPLAVYEATARLVLPGSEERELMLAFGRAETSQDGMNLVHRWAASATIDFAAIGTAASEAESNGARLAIGAQRRVGAPSCDCDLECKVNAA